MAPKNKGCFRCGSVACDGRKGKEFLYCNAPLDEPKRWEGFPEMPKGQDISNMLTEDALCSELLNHAFDRCNDGVSRADVSFRSNPIWKELLDVAFDKLHKPKTKNEKGKAKPAQATSSLTINTKKQPDPPAPEDSTPAGQPVPEAEMEKFQQDWREEVAAKNKNDTKDVQPKQPVVQPSLSAGLGHPARANTLQAAPPPRQAPNRPTRKGPALPLKRCAQPWKLDSVQSIALQKADSKQPDPHPYAFWKSCPTNETKVNTGAQEGEKVRIVTNFLKVQKVPDTVYVYSLKYVAPPKDSAVNTNETTAASSDSEETSPHPANESIKATTYLDQRSQKRLIFGKLKDLPPFKDRNDWATDFDTVWSIKPLIEVEEGSDEPAYQRIDGPISFNKLSGKPDTIPFAELTFLRALSFMNNGKPDPLLLLNSDKNDKGASVHITALNALISHHVTSTQDKVFEAGPNAFYIKNAFKEFKMLLAYRGYSTSIRPGSDGILLNVSIKTGAFYQPVTVDAFLREMSDKDYYEYGNGKHRGQQLLKGRKVFILYHREKIESLPNYDPNKHENRHRVVAGFGQRPSQQMFVYNGTDISVMDYFQKVLGANPPPSDDWNCVNLGVTPRFIHGEADPTTDGKQVWIPPQYLMIDSEQPFARRLAAPHMDGMLKNALRHPAANQRFIVEEGLPTLGIGGDIKDLQKLKMEVQPKLLEISARILGEPKLQYSDKVVQPSKGASWSLIHGKDNKPVTFVKVPSDKPGSILMGTIDFSGNDSLKGLGPRVVQRVKDHGILGFATPKSDRYGSLPKKVLEQPDLDEGNKSDVDGNMQSDPNEKMESNRHQKIKDVHSAIGSPKMNLIVLPSADSNNYAAVKRVFDQRIGAHTVCITAGKVLDRGQLKADDSNQKGLFSNLALKVNLKLGGQNHSVLDTIGLSPFSGIKSDTLVVGADVSHAPSQMSSCPSVAAIVASDYSDFAHFPGSMRLQASKQEFITDLEGMMYERIVRYGHKNKKFPNRVLYYRDGVGEDMFDRVVAEEESQIHKAFDNVKSDVKALIKSGELPTGFNKNSVKTLSVTFIVVGKRHNTRFFCKDESQSSKMDTPQKDISRAMPGSVKQPDGRWSNCHNGNVKPGLLVDDIITRPKDKKSSVYDFFLQSHQALKGTARAAHYTVLKDGGLTKDVIYKVTHGFCFNFARATKGVSYVGPAYYADRLCERGTLYLRAYTQDRDEPELDMKDEEISGGQDGALEYAKRVARHVQDHSLWNPKAGQDPKKTTVRPRKNPWHPKMDEVMFWL